MENTLPANIPAEVQIIPGLPTTNTLTILEQLGMNWEEINLDKATEKLPQELNGPAQQSSISMMEVQGPKCMPVSC